MGRLSSFKYINILKIKRKYSILGHEEFKAGVGRFFLHFRFDLGFSLRNKT